MRTGGRPGLSPPGDRPRLPLSFPLLLGVLPALLAAAGGARSFRRATPPPPADAVVLPEPVLASMNERFLANNEHWDEAPVRKGGARYRMQGVDRATPLEYMGCLQGEVRNDTLRIHGWREPRDLVQFQFGVDGSCEQVPDLVGTWHTHPYRVERVGGEPVKVPSLSPADLRTFAEGRDAVILAVWDVDSVDAATRGPGGEVVHPAPVVVVE